MKKFIFNIIIVVNLLITPSSCNFLDIVPDDTATLADAFKNETTAEAFVYSCYGHIPNFFNWRENYSWATSNEIVGSYHLAIDYWANLLIQHGIYSPNAPVIDYWSSCYKGIRQCYIFLNNIDKVTPVNMPIEQFEDKKEEWKAEVKFLIAYFHYLLLQNYGPVCLVKEELSINGNNEALFLKRSPYDECVQQIATWFNEAMEILPATWPASDYGRATKVAAQALKARMYLFAASPLFNGNSEFYANFKNKDGENLISQVYDKEKWKIAMDETLKAIELAKSSGHDLYKYNNGKSLSDFDQAVANTRYTLLERWNKEILWAYTGNREGFGGENYQTLVIPNGFRDGSKPPYGCYGPTLTAVEMFYSKKGIPISKDNSYDYDNRFKIAEGDSTIQLHRNREPRFYACIGFDRGNYEINGDTVILQMKFGERDGCKNVNTEQLYSGYAVKKGVHPNSQVTSTTFTIEDYPYTIIRLGELYLNYAEAYAQYTGKLDGKALEYFNAIRSKAGIPNFQTAFGNPTNDELIDIIHHERLIELMFEGQWLYDLKRWKKAEDFFKEDALGMRGLNSAGTNNEDFYQDIRLIGRPLIFSRKQYLHPIDNNSISVNQNLVQNPYW